MPSKSWTQSNPSLTWSFLARHLQNTVTNRTALVDDNEILRYIRDKLNNFPCTCTANSYVTRLFVPLMSTPTKHLRGQRHSTAIKIFLQRCISPTSSGILRISHVPR